MSKRAGEAQGQARSPRANGYRGRSFGAISYKLGNCLSIETDNAEGFPHYGTADKRIVEEFHDRPAELEQAATEIDATLQ